MGKKLNSREKIGETNSFHVVLLLVGKLIIVKKDWIENINSVQTRIFYSPNGDDHPIFNEPFYYFKENIVGCYLGNIHRSFGKFVFLIKLQHVN